jgi:uncharacterized protein YecT (DUF1311 family)
MQSWKISTGMRSTPRSHGYRRVVAFTRRSAAQRLWVQYRDANCGFYGVQDGSIRQVQAAECIRSMTEDRAHELEEAMKLD